MVKRINTNFKMTHFRKLVYDAVLQHGDCSIVDIANTINAHSNPVSCALRWLEYANLVELYPIYADGRYWLRVRLNNNLDEGEIS